MRGNCDTWEYVFVAPITADILNSICFWRRGCPAEISAMGPIQDRLPVHPGRGGTSPTRAVSIRTGSDQSRGGMEYESFSREACNSYSGGIPYDWLLVRV